MPRSVITIRWTFPDPRAIDIRVILCNHGEKAGSGSHLERKRKKNSCRPRLFKHVADTATLLTSSSCGGRGAFAIPVSSLAKYS